MNDFFQLELDEASGIARLTLSRPERMNTMSPPFFPAVRDAVMRLDDAGRTRVLVIDSTGRHFSAGMALDVFGGFDVLKTASARSRLAFVDNLRRLMACFDAIEQVRFPVIAAVQGGCVGGGVDLASACDMRLCSADAFFTVQEIHIGMAADLGTLQRLPKIVPQALAREMAYTGDRIDAQRALTGGLVNAVLPDAAALHEAAMALARKVAAKSPLAIAGSKRALNHARDYPVPQALDQMALLQAAIFDIDEMARAIEAWRTKGDAAFDALDPIRTP